MFVFAFFGPPLGGALRRTAQGFPYGMLNNQRNLKLPQQSTLIAFQYNVSADAAKQITMVGKIDDPLCIMIKHTACDA